MNGMKLLLIGLGFVLNIGNLCAQEMHFASGPQQTTLIELYTSEGCSSCPPAEAWLSRLEGDPGLWKKIVPLAFHVDYWDKLGWPDRYASAEWTARQNHYASFWATDSIYTPEMVRDGKEWQNWAGERIPPNEQRTGELTATSKDGQIWSIEFHPANATAAEWDAHIALLGGGVSAKIGAGENGGRTLRHDFVVLGMQSAPLHAGKASLTNKGLRVDAPRKAIAIWVTRRGELVPAQATGGWLATR